MIYALLLVAASLSANAAIETNEVRMASHPKWLDAGRVRKVTAKVQDFLEWRIRRINVYFHSDPKAFRKLHRWNTDKIQAFYRYRDKTIHLGPKVNNKNFDPVFGHELVHTIVHQKYGKSVPIWLQEGLANFVANKDKVDYKWLAKQPKKDPTKLSHPKASGENSRYHYQASLALVEMINDKCTLSDLLQLSVGKRMETYLKNYCEIKDLNGNFQTWLKDKASGKKKKPYWWGW